MFINHSTPKTCLSARHDNFSFSLLNKFQITRVWEYQISLGNCYASNVPTTNWALVLQAYYMKKKIGLIDLICICERSSVKRTTQHNR